MSRFPLWFLVAAGCGTDAYIDAPPAIGRGLTNAVGVRNETCDQALFSDRDCHEVGLELSAARSNNDAAALMEIKYDLAWFRGEQLGSADIEVETRNGGAFGASIEIVEIGHQSLVGCALNAPCIRPAHFTNTEARFNPVFYGHEAETPHELGGYADYAVEGVDAEIVETGDRLLIATGPRAGTATIHASTGAEESFDIVGIDQIAAFEMFDSYEPINESIAVGRYTLEIELRPTLADGREIKGATTDMPTVESDSIQIEAKPMIIGENQIVVTRVGRGDATLTIRWGHAVSTLRITDPSL